MFSSSSDESMSLDARVDRSRDEKWVLRAWTVRKSGFVEWTPEELEEIWSQNKRQNRDVSMEKKEVLVVSWKKKKKKKKIK